MIGYCVSDSVAVQMYERELVAPGEGLTAFYDYVDQAPEETFAGLVARCGLEDPLSAGRITALAEMMEQQLFEATV